MDWGAFLVILAMATLAGLYVGMPIIQRQGDAVTAAEHTRSALLARREQVLTTLAELEFDHETGKISDDHYQQRRQALLQEGADILRELDALTASRSGQSGASKATTQDASAQMETLLAQRRAERQMRHPPSQADDAIEALLAARRRARQTKSGGFCPQCGAPVLVTDRFCPRCGTPLTPSS